MTLRVIGIGNRLVGDDGAGPSVVERLQLEGVPPGVELLYAPDAAGLISLLQTPHSVLVVDAVVGAGPPGEVVELEEPEIALASDRLLSTHGLDVARAITLARILFGPEAAPQIRMIGVRIDLPQRWSAVLSPAAAAAIARAAGAVRRRITRSRVGNLPPVP